jgi:hypothetical protein
MIYPKLQAKNYTSPEFRLQFQKQQEDSIMMLAITQKIKLLKHVIVSSFRTKVSGIPQVLQEVENLQFYIWSPKNLQEYGHSKQQTGKNCHINSLSLLAE